MNSFGATFGFGAVGLVIDMSVVDVVVHLVNGTLSVDDWVVVGSGN